MTPHGKLSRKLRRTILGMVVVYGSTTAAACCRPIVCDPAPPPSLARRPTATGTPMICDPPPPPALTRQPTGARTPMICDPAPPPRGTSVGRPTATGEAATLRFRANTVRVMTDASLEDAVVQGRVRDRQGQPVPNLRISAQMGAAEVSTATDTNGAYLLRLSQPGSYLLMVEGDRNHGLTLDLKRNDVATIDWEETDRQSQLPLAEIRSVAIVWDEGLTCHAESPWPGARYRWSATGGSLKESGGRVTWEPPAEPGRYLVQVVADWGATGLAVDAQTVVVDGDGTITIS